MTTQMLNTVDIAPDFSVYALVKRVNQESTMLQSRRAMTMISNEIENTSLIDGAKTRIFSGFQYLSKFTPQAERYRQMAENSDEIYVFGVPDTDTLPHIPGVSYVPITPQHQLSKEWFLISYGKDYYSALVTEELTRFTDPDDQRQFEGLWTFDLAMVSTLHEWLSGLVGLSPHISQADDDVHHFERQIKLMSSTVGRLMARVKL